MSLAEELQRLLEPVIDDRWLTPEEAGDPYSDSCPVDHEGCQVWPWRSEDAMKLAYWLRNHATEILAALTADESERNDHGE